MAATTTERAAHDEDIVVLRSNKEMSDGLTVSGKAESSISKQLSLEERATMESSSYRCAPTPAITIGGVSTMSADSKADKLPNAVYSHDRGHQSRGTSPPPAKRLRANDTIPATNSSIAEASSSSSSSSKMTERSSKLQGPEVVNLVSPDRPLKHTLETRLHRGPHELLSASRPIDGSLPWSPEHVSAATVDQLQRSLHASLRAESSQPRKPDRIIGSDTENLRPPDEKPRRQFSHRVKTGCFTCRERKKKCDEAKPVCGNCVKGKYQCLGYGTKPLRKMGSDQMPYIVDQSTLEGRGAPTMLEQPCPGPYPGHSGFGPVGQQCPPPLHHTRDVRPPPSYPPWSGHFQMVGVTPNTTKHGPVDIQNHSRNERWPSAGAHDTCPPAAHHPRLKQYQRHSGDSIRAPIDDGTLSTTPITHMPNDADGDRDKMLVGEAFRPWKSTTLLCDRRDCKEAVDLYNRGAMPGEALSQEERAYRFGAILNPFKRQRQTGTAHSIGRIGHCGSRTIVDAPFHCDYGYNLVIGSDTVIFPNCYIQDPCEILIGNQVIIGPNCRLYGMTAHIDHRRRGGSQGEFRGGTIQIMDGAWIGGDVVIMPYRIIGEGAIVGAGSVVTRNIRPYTIVAGNPAREVRVLDPHQTHAERRTRIEIEQENEYMIGSMRRRRFGEMNGC